MEQNKQSALVEAGKRLRLERLRLGLSQRDLAQQVGLTREMWGRYERGMVQINQQTLTRFIGLGASARLLPGGQANPIATPITAESVRNALGLLADVVGQMPLSEEEMQLLACFRHAEPSRRKSLLEIVCHHDQGACGGMG